MACVYFVQASQLRLIKIGLAADPADRLTELRVGSPDHLSLLGFIRCADVRAAAALERELHRQFRADRSHGEWFKRSEALMTVVAERSERANADAEWRLYLQALAVCHSGDSKRRVRYAERRRREMYGDAA